MTSSRDRPDAAELLDAVRELLAGDISHALTGRLRFHARVAVNIVDIVRRELEFGADDAQRQQGRLEAIGFADDVELANAIRHGLPDGEYERVAAVVREATWDRLRVVNPRYPEPYRSPTTAREDWS